MPKLSVNVFLYIHFIINIDSIRIFSIAAFCGKIHAKNIFTKRAVEVLYQPPDTMKGGLHVHRR